MKKVMVIVPFAMGEDDLARRKTQLDAVDLGPGLAFHFKPVRVGPKNYSSQHDMALADFSILDAGLDAEKDGFDAICIDTMSDSGMAMLRSVLTIPVIAPGRHSMLLAQMLGEKFSILMMWDRWKMLYTKTLGELGMEHKCASMRSIGITPDNKTLLSGTRGSGRTHKQFWGQSQCNVLSATSANHVAKSTHGTTRKTQGALLSHGFMR
jgi:Asp/Glu/hydantoin racemase